VNINKKIVILFLIMLICLSLFIVNSIVNAGLGIKSQSSPLGLERAPGQLKKISEKSNPEFIGPVMIHPDELDIDFNNIEDTLEQKIDRLIQEGKVSEEVRVIVDLYNPYTQEQLNTFSNFGGEILHTFEYVSYGFSGYIPAESLIGFSNSLGGELVFIGEAKKMKPDLDLSTRLIRARPIVWGTYGYTGNSDTRVAVIDTGVDDSHRDLIGRIVAWTDVAQGQSNPYDLCGHGTHCAGIVAGTGTMIKDDVTPLLQWDIWSHADDLAIDEDRNVYVLYGIVLEKFDKEGNLLTDWSPKANAVDVSPNGFVYTGGYYSYGADAYSAGNVSKYSRNGNFLGSWLTTYPVTDLKVDNGGNVYVLGRFNDSFEKYSSSGNLLFSKGGSGSSNGKFNMPYSLAFDNEGNIWVSDQYNNRLQQFDTDGNFLYKWNFANDQYPRHMTIDSVGYFYIIMRKSNENQRIYQYDSSRNYVMDFDHWDEYKYGCEYMGGPTHIEVDNGENFFVTEDVRYKCDPDPTLYRITQIMKFRSVNPLSTTFDSNLPDTDDYGKLDTVEIPSTGYLYLDVDFGGSGSIRIKCKNPAKSYIDPEITGANHPMLANYTVSTAGNHYPGVYDFYGTSLNRPFSAIENYPYSRVGDGYYTFRGVAPGVELVGVKIGGTYCGGSEDEMIEGLDWVVANRDTYNIKIATMSFGMYEGGQNSTLRNKANNVVNNGIILTISAGNEFPSYKIGDPGLASKVITVGATNDMNQMTSYSSNGPANFPRKPDVVAPGGTSPYLSGANSGTEITAIDSNDGDGRYGGLTDRSEHDYTNKLGTSMACPHVAGLAALIIDAQESNGQPYGYTQQEALAIKGIILMTATETNAEGESDNNPPLNRGGKDRVEGYGRINADAAIEAIINEHSIGTTDTSSLGSGATDKKAWASQLTDLRNNREYTFDLSLPSGEDFDLYIYSITPDSDGNPVIIDESVSDGTGTDETIIFVPTIDNSDYYLVVKWVSGSGSFSVSSSSTPVSTTTTTSTITTTTSTTTTTTTTVPTTTTSPGGGGGGGGSAFPLFEPAI